MRALVGVPELDGGIIPAAGKQVTIGGKGKGLDSIGPPVRPEQIPAFDVPQLESTIPASRGERLSIRVEGEVIRVAEAHGDQLERPALGVRPAATPTLVRLLFHLSRAINPKHLTSRCS